MSNQLEVVRRKAIPEGYVNLLDATIQVASTYPDGAQKSDWSTFIGVFRNRETKTRYRYVSRRGRLLREKVRFNEAEKAEWKTRRSTIHLARKGICNGAAGQRDSAVGKILFPDREVQLNAETAVYLFRQHRPAFSSGYVRADGALGMVLIDSMWLENLLLKKTLSPTVVRTERHEVQARCVQFHAALRQLFMEEYGQVSNWPYFKKEYLTLLVEEVLIRGMNADGSRDQAWAARRPVLSKKQVRGYVSDLVPAECFDRKPGQKSPHRLRQGEKFLQSRPIEIGLK